MENEQAEHLEPEPESEPALAPATAADDGLEPSVVLAEQASAEDAPATEPAEDESEPALVAATAADDGLEPSVVLAEQASTEDAPATAQADDSTDDEDEPALVAATAADDGLEPSVVLAEQASAENASPELLQMVEKSAAEPVQEQLLPEAVETSEPSEPIVDRTDAQLRAILEAIIYITDEPLTAEQMAVALREPRDRIKTLLGELTQEFARPERGLSILEIAGGYKMATKAEHHEAVRAFVRNLKPPLKLSLPALETLAVIAYKQPITAPEIMDIRGVQGAGVLKTLLDRKLIAAGGRKNVVGKPILYKTTREFLVQFGLKDVGELPSLKEFEELGRFAISDADDPVTEPAASVEPQAEPDAPVEPQPEQA